MSMNVFIKKYIKITQLTTESFTFGEKAQIKFIIRFVNFTGND